MLYTETVTGTTLELLRSLEQEEMLSYSKIFFENKYGLHTDFRK